MFLIAGIQPKIKKLEDTPRQCPSCGQFQAYRKRMDHYLSLFFIPLLKVKTGQPFILCDRCARTESPESLDRSAGSAPRKPRCSDCGRSLKPEFSFCPFCGTAR